VPKRLDGHEALMWWGVDAVDLEAAIGWQPERASKISHAVGVSVRSHAMSPTEVVDDIEGWDAGRSHTAMWAVAHS
jgi:hypothetical protein